MTQEEYDEFLEIKEKFDREILKMVPAFVASKNYSEYTMDANGALYIDEVEEVEHRGVLVGGMERWRLGGRHHHQEFIPVEFIINFKPTED